MLVLLSRVVSCLKILYLFCSNLQVLHKFYQIANPQLFRGPETFPTSKLNIPNENFRHEVVVDNLEGLIKDNWSYEFVCMMLGLKNKLNSQFNPLFHFFFNFGESSSSSLNCFGSIKAYKDSFPLLTTFQYYMDLSVFSEQLYQILSTCL